MKKLSLILGLSAVLFTGCSKNELSKEEALQQIRKAKEYPKVLEHDILYSDPYHATLLLNKGLESAGLVTVDRTQKMIDVGKPLVHFTKKADPYLINGSPEQWSHDFAMGIQRVKIAVEDITEVTSVTYGADEKSAIVDYNVSYKDITPFSLLLKRDLKKPEGKQAYFLLKEDKWVVQKRMR